MADLGFVRNESARQLRAGKSRLLAYVMLDATNPFFTDVAAGVEDAAEAADLSLFMCNSHNSAAREKAYLDHLVEQRVQGILITPVDPESPTLDEVVRRGTPLVVVDRIRGGDDVCSVSVDDELGGRLAVEHLVDRGHQRVAYVGGPTSIGQVRDRWVGAGQRLGGCRPAGGRPAPGGHGRTERGGGPTGRRAPAGPARAPPPHGRLLRQRPDRPRTAAALHHQWPAGCPRTWPSSATTTSSSPRPPPCRSPPCGSRASCSASGRPSCCSTRPRTPTHVHERVVFTPELVARASTLG